jgi:hypothetical protein
MIGSFWIAISGATYALGFLQISLLILGLFS